jgi:lipid-binding SYLF domain-containing protein
MRALVIAASFIVTAGTLMADTPQERLKESADVLSEVMQTPDKGIPQDLLAKAQCVIIVPNMLKAAFVVGGQYGRGFAVCREPNGSGWTAPAPVRMEGGSVGFQIGGSSTDLIMLVMSKRGMNKLLQDKFTLGVDASVAAGPVGRTANAVTDLQMHAEILAYSRSRGLFAGVALNGATLRPDPDEDGRLYGKNVTNAEILHGTVATPPSARQLIAELDRYSSRSGSAARTQ